MNTLRDYIKKAETEKKAIGHFNIANSEGLSAVWNATQKISNEIGEEIPVIIGVSEGERDFIGIERVVAMVRSLREKYKHPIFLNADHTYSVEKCIEAIDAGFDAVIYDGVKLSVEENIQNTKKVVEYARKQNGDIIVESELGFIGSSSKILKELPKGAEVTEDLMTKPEKAKYFVEATGIDLLAPAIGNVHGMIKGEFSNKLNSNRVKEIKEQSGVPLVLHGGSGSREEEFVDVINSGVVVVHISTELRLALKEGIEEYINKNPDEIAPYRYMNDGVKKMSEVIENKLRLFNKLS